MYRIVRYSLAYRISFNLCRVKLLRIASFHNICFIFADQGFSHLLLSLSLPLMLKNLLRSGTFFLLGTKNKQMGILKLSIYTQTRRSNWLSNCTYGLTNIFLASSDSAQRGINEESSSVQELAAVSVLQYVDSWRLSCERHHFCNLWRHS